MSSWKQQKNAGRLAWLIIFTPGTLLIWYLEPNRLFATLYTSIWASITYLIVPPILKDLGIWDRFKK